MEYVQGDQELYAFIIGKTGLSAHTLNISRQELFTKVAQLLENITGQDLFDEVAPPETADKNSDSHLAHDCIDT